MIIVYWGRTLTNYILNKRYLYNTQYSYMISFYIQFNTQPSNINTFKTFYNLAFKKKPYGKKHDKLLI